MSRSENPVIGSIICEAGNTAKVYQSKRRGSQFYLRCDCCGLDQRAGKAFQTKIWKTAKFDDGAAFVRPSVVDIDAERGQVVSEVGTDPRLEADYKEVQEELDFVPVETEPEHAKAPRLGMLLAGVTFLVGGIGGVLWNQR